jgi:hypothetical protein
MLNAFLLLLCALLAAALLWQTRKLAVLRARHRRALRMNVEMWNDLEYERERANKAALRAEWIESELVEASAEEAA